MFIKICGITNIEDALLAAEAGCDGLGFVFAKSPRRITPNEALAIIEGLPPSVKKVGVFVNERPDRVREIARISRLDIVQFHGEETPEYCSSFEYPIIKAFRIKGSEDVARFADYRISAYLLDSYTEGIYGGTGKQFDWEVVLKAKRFGPIILAGGLDPSNVGSAVKKVRPYGVDVSSGVEVMPGKKDPLKIKAFIEAVRACERITYHERPAEWPSRLH